MIKKTNYKSKSKCADESFYQCYGSMLSDIYFQTKCLPRSILPMISDDKKLLPCETNDNLEYAYELTHERYKTVMKLNSCPLPCTIIQYTGKVEFWDPKYGSFYQNNRRVSEQLSSINCNDSGVQVWGAGICPLQVLMVLIHVTSAIIN